MNTSSRKALPVVILLGLAVLVWSQTRKPTDTTSSGSAGQAALPGAPVLHLAYFPNVTHAPGIVGVANGSFQKAVGNSVVVKPYVFNAGPEEMEALLAGQVDIGYVGPGPATNAFAKSQGRALVIIAGACDNGASLVAASGARISTVKDLDGKRVAVPQVGGTQDISLRHFLSQQGLKTEEKGGTVKVLGVKNPDILTLFKKGDLDAAWVPEPWASRLVEEAHARVVVDEKDLWPAKRFSTTVVVARKDYLEKHPQQVAAFLQAHAEVVSWLKTHPEDGQKLVNSELKRLTGKQLSAKVLKDAWGHVDFVSEPNRESIDAQAKAAVDAGYLSPGASLDGLVAAK